MSAPRTRDGRRVSDDLTPQQRLAQGVPGEPTPVVWQRPPAEDAQRFGRLMWFAFLLVSTVLFFGRDYL